MLSSQGYINPTAKEQPKWKKKKKRAELIAGMRNWNGVILNDYYYMKEAHLKRLHTVILTRVDPWRSSVCLSLHICFSFLIYFNFVFHLLSNKEWKSISVLLLFSIKHSILYFIFIIFSNLSYLAYIFFLLPEFIELHRSTCM